MNYNQEENINYIWQNYSTENRFTLLHEYSLKEAEQHGNQILVNPLVRFSEIFSANYFKTLSENTHGADSLDIQKTSFETLYDVDDEIPNLLFHYLAQLDLLCGHYLTHSYKDLFTNEILEGRYGQELCENFSKLNTKDRDIIAIYLQKYHEIGEKKDFFDDVFFDFFGRINNLYNEDFDADYTKHSAEIYYQRSTDTFYYFCAAEGSEYNKIRFSVARALFADCTKNICPVWGKYCFGIINENYREYAAVPIVNQIQII